MSVAKTRARLGLYSPYGPGAKKSGHGEETHPHAARPVAANLANRTSRLLGLPLGGFGRSGRPRPPNASNPPRRPWPRGRPTRFSALTAVQMPF